VRKLLPRLRDPKFTKVLLVTLPEATPVHEARRSRTTCGAPASSRSPGSSTRASPATTSAIPCCATAAAGVAYLDEVRDEHAARLAWVPWKAEAAGRSPETI
jgi:arsenite/tail-anchored protein-transporting ATPase